MVLYTTSNYMKIYDLSKREFKQIGVTRRFEDSTGPLGELNKCSVNSNGSKVNRKKEKKYKKIPIVFYIYFEFC